MRQALENPFYYLENFQQVLSWVGRHHGDLLDEHERAFLDRFPQLPQASRALLVRMVMRKGALFRASKLLYGEIGCPHRAAQALIEQGWVGPAPALSLEQLFGLLKKNELVQIFGAARASSLRKSELLENLRPHYSEARPLEDWCAQLDDKVFALCIDPLCERLRLMFFGNIHQDWSEFVLADLGIYRYEQVPFSSESRAFQSRADLDAYLQLQRSRERFDAGDDLAEVLADIPRQPYANDWLESRRGKLLLRIAQQFERLGELPEALRLHACNRYPTARERAIRVLERCGQPEAALELALQAQAAPESEHETQQLERLLPRLQRALGLQTARCHRTEPERIDLVLPRAASVEQAVREHLSTPQAPLYYVENALVGSLFGLLCWEAIFAPLPGAFFHPFHWAPADLNRPDFHQRRAELFARCLACLDSDDYRDCIQRTFQAKFGIHNAFVAWGLLDDQLLQQALDCLPAAHLKLMFQRILADVCGNRSGLPDLIQLWPSERRYRMIEVKGPGDRLQDNQKRWLDYAHRHGLPVAVCYVRWAETAQ
ncbi:VRR-NUC domain-containing protein [Pseudomonas lopnurensis]|uniref:VRR-NUC domain-containing protein n=1 Tax=Pseudomonas lopnurensis TaxID=1477517 RepID=UPI00187A7C42|nr:VRR-NUC domain-containing protein [Pseudomonas lopnurensis]MBE7377133.1 VRR-NUC domain-containing protein [Pseudomonas lopnurensis]